MENRDKKPISVRSLLAGAYTGNVPAAFALAFMLAAVLAQQLHYSSSAGVVAVLRENTRDLGELKAQITQLEETVKAATSSGTAWVPGLPPLSTLPSSTSGNSGPARTAPLPDSLLRDKDSDALQAGSFVLSGEKSGGVLPAMGEEKTEGAFVLSEGAINRPASRQFILVSEE